MIEKVRKSVFVVMIIYSITIVLLMLYSYNTSYNKISFKDSNENIKTLEKYKEELKQLEDSTCKNAINELIKHYEDTSYNEEINLNEKYFKGKSLLSYTLDTFKKCNIPDEETRRLGLKFLEATIEFDEVVNELYFQYEIKIPDISNRKIIKPEMNQIRYQINRSIHLEIIKELIDKLKEEK